MNYAKAAEEKSEKVDLTLKQVQAFYGFLKENDGDVYITSQEVKTMLAKTTIVYKMIYKPNKTGL